MFEHATGQCPRHFPYGSPGCPACADAPAVLRGEQYTSEVRAVPASAQVTPDADLLAEYRAARAGWEQATEARNAAEVRMNGLLLDALHRGLDPYGEAP